MSRWTHAICDKCWVKRFLESKNLFEWPDGPNKLCCFCGESTNSGIYVREDPNKLLCNGVHNEETSI